MHSARDFQALAKVGASHRLVLVVEGECRQAGQQEGRHFLVPELAVQSEAPLGTGLGLIKIALEVGHQAHDKKRTCGCILVVEILSPKNNYAETRARASDYFRMGVTAVWIVDPRVRSGHWSTRGVWT